MLSKALQAAAGNAGEATYVDDVFSTYLYTGNGSTQTITNNIDLAGEGGLVWTKRRDAAADHALQDTAGYGKYLITNSTLPENGEFITSFNAAGFTLTGSTIANRNAATYASWTFRKAAKFFDVVTFVGTGANPATQYNHNLGTTPGCIIVKNISSSQAWYVYHRSLSSPANDYLALNTTAASATISGIWGTVNDTQFGFFGNSGQTYVAYLFAHDAGGFGADGSENVISCGSVSHTTSSTITLGYEPQFIIYKRTDAAGDWNMMDTMRSASATGVFTYLFPNYDFAESSNQRGTVTSTGFTFNSGLTNGTYIYVAIRRPMKPPESGTEVFTPTTYTGNGTSQVESAGFPTDMAIITNRGAGGGYERNVGDRLRGGNRTLFTTLTVVESTATNRITAFDNMVGVAVGSDGDVNQSSGSQIAWNFKRAPGFFDVVCYTGDSVNPRTITHNLSVAPELIIVKKRNNIGSWFVYSLGTGATNYLVLNATDASASGGIFNNTTPTSASFQVYGSSLNANGSTYVAYLFATYPGVSKCTAFTGTGTLQTINCGFTSGARFVLIKRTDSTGDWYVWDSARGISSSNDPYLLLNSTAAEVTTTNWVDTASTGFQLTAAAGNNVNINGASYIVLAIA